MVQLRPYPNDHAVVAVTGPSRIVWSLLALTGVAPSGLDTTI